MLTFEFNGVRGIMTRDAPLTSGMVGRRVKIVFSPEWEDLRKTAVFRSGDVTRDVVEVSGETVIPAKVLEVPHHRLYVGIYGTNAAGDTVIPTVWAEGPMVEEGAAPSGDPSTEEETPVWQQILTMLGSLNDLTSKARENLVAAINEVAQPGGLPLPDSAAVDQFLVVTGVDEKGKVTATGTVTLPDAEGAAF